MEGALDFIPGASKLATVSLAHTTADYDTAMAAFRAGASHVTHLFNAMPPFAHRDPGVVGAASDSGVNVELICDGVHIHPAVVRAVFQAVRRRPCDSHQRHHAGGRYAGWGLHPGRPGGEGHREPRGAGGRNAGRLGHGPDGLHEDRGLLWYPAGRRGAGGGLQPAKVLGIDDQVGTLDLGKQANVVLLDENLNLRTVIFHGQVQ